MKRRDKKDTKASPWPPPLRVAHGFVELVALSGATVVHLPGFREGRKRRKGATNVCALLPTFIAPYIPEKMPKNRECKATQSTRLHWTGCRDRNPAQPGDDGIPRWRPRRRKAGSARLLIVPGIIVVASTWPSESTDWVFNLCSPLRPFVDESSLSLPHDAINIPWFHTPPPSPPSSPPPSHPSSPLRRRKPTQTSPDGSFPSSLNWGVTRRLLGLDADGRMSWMDEMSLRV